MSDISERLKAGRLPERTVEVCLRGDLVAEFEEIERQYRAELNKPSTSLADGGEVALLGERMEAVRAQMQGEMLTIRLQALPRRVWSELIAAHPSRVNDDGTTNAEDENFGYNSATFFEALIRESIVDPQLSSEDWQALDDILTDSAFQSLANAAVLLNRRGVDVPFLPAALRPIVDSDSE